MNDEMKDKIYAKMNATLEQLHPIEDSVSKAEADERKRLRAIRRAAALNAVHTARFHAGRHEELYTQSDADVIMAIMELLDRVAEK
jgi:hypothetical protein